MTVLGLFLEGFLTGVAVTLLLAVLLPFTIVCCYRRCKRRSAPKYQELQSIGSNGTYVETMTLPKDEIHLTGRPVLDALMFQEKWGKLGICSDYRTSLTTDGDLEATLASAHILCIASGAVGGQLKYYFYAQETSEEIYLIEVFLTLADRSLGCTFKADNPARCQAKFLDYFKDAIRPLCRR